MDEKKWLYDFRVAYKRLRNKYDETTEEYFNSVVWLGKLSRFRKTQKDDNNIEFESTFDCVRNFYKESYKDLKHRTDAELKGAKDFVIEMHFSKEEAKEWLEKIEKKTEKALKDFDTLFEFNLKLFEFKPTESHDVETDYDYVKNIIKKLFIKDKLEIYPIETIRIINARGKGIGSFQKKYLSSDSTFDFLTSGTYFDKKFENNRLIYFACGSVISEISNYKCEVEKSEKRGGLAVLNSGIINIKHTNSHDIGNIKERFKDVIGSEIGEREIPELKEENNIDKVFEFIGGGALLINNGSIIAGKEDLLKIQKFDQTHTMKVKDKDGNEIEKTIPPTGYNAVQLIGARKRILIAKLNEVPFLLFVNKNAIELQKLLSDNGFSDLICFDGGGAIYFATPQKEIEKIGNVSPSGFAVKVERKYEQ